MTSSQDEQQAYWNGRGGDRWTQQQEVLDRMVRPFGEAALAQLAARGGERVLDVGCGCGDTLGAILERVGPRGQATGIDLSERMLERARERVPLARVIAGDVGAHDFGAQRFDGIFSRFGVMFFADAPRTFARLRALLSEQESRLAFVCWRSFADNPWATVPLQAAQAALPGATAGVDDGTDGPGPFSLANRDALAHLLRDAGFARVQVTPFEHDLARP
jgi:trans-aconitate methyltransferase